MTAATATLRPRDRTSGLQAVSRTTWIDLAVLTVLSGLSIAGFEPAFGPYNYLLAAIGGLVVGTAAALVCFLFRITIVPTIAIALGGYVLFGTAFAMPAQGIGGVIPSLTSLAGMFQGAVFGWADIVTLQTPVEAPPYIAVVPYFATWLVALISVTVAVRWLPRTKRTALRSSVLVLPALVLYFAGIIIGTSEPYFAGIRGVAFAVIALV